MELLDPEAVTHAALARLRARLDESAAAAGNSRYAQALRDDDGIRRLIAGDWPLQWSAKYRFVSDDPAKVTMEERDARARRRWAPRCCR